MHLVGAFELEIRPGTSDHPAGVKIALVRYTRGEDGRLFVTRSASPSRRSKNRRPERRDAVRGRAIRLTHEAGGFCHIKESYLPILFLPRMPVRAFSMARTGGAHSQNGLYLLDGTKPVARRFDPEADLNAAMQRTIAWRGETVARGPAIPL
jgi:hypothetical protein